MSPSQLSVVSVVLLLSCQAPVSSPSAPAPRTDRAPLVSPTVSGAAPWRSLGPFWARSQYFGGYTDAHDVGRVTRLKLHPTDPNTLYASTAGGGLWRSTTWRLPPSPSSDWTPLTDSLAPQAIGAFDFAPSNPSVLYVGLGDPFEQQGGGWARSTDGGATWSAVRPLTGTSPVSGLVLRANHVRDLVVDPLDPNRVFIATDVGLFISTDGVNAQLLDLPQAPAWGPTYEGAWSIVSLGGGGWLVSGVYGCPSLGRPPNFPLGLLGTATCASNTLVGNQGDIWRSTDDGQTWVSAYAGGLFPSALTASQATNFGRLALTAVPSGPSTSRVYALASRINENSAQTVGVLRSDNGGQSWSLVATPASAPSNPTLNANCTTLDIGHGAAHVNLAIAVDPGNPDQLLIGGDLCSARSKNGGASWELTSHFLGTDTVRGRLPLLRGAWHAASVVRLGGVATALGATSAGPFVSRDVFDAAFGEAVHWDQPNYGLANQLLHALASGDPATGDPGLLFAGAQDLGVRWMNGVDVGSTLTGELRVWDQLAIGTGSGVAIAPDPAGLNPVLWSSTTGVRRFCRPRARDCSRATRFVEGVEVNNWLTSSWTLPVGDSQPFIQRTVDLGDGSVITATNLNLWRLRVNTSDVVSATRLTPSGLAGCGATRSVRAMGPAVAPGSYLVDGTPARLYGVPLSGGCVAVVVDKTTSVTVAGAATTVRVADPAGSGNVVQVLNVSSVAIPHDPTHLGGTDARATYLVASSSYESATGGPVDPAVGRLFKTVDQGASWVPFHGNGTQDLPNVPIHVVKFDPSDPTDATLYVGTDVGLYVSTDTGQTWARVGQGLPPVRISDLHISRNGSVVRVATYGRGAWELHRGSEARTVAGNGDFDRDGVIDFFDLASLATRMGVSPLANPLTLSAPWYDWNVDLGGANPALIEEDDLSALVTKFGGAP